jgi:hypothetical protein
MNAWIIQPTGREKAREHAVVVSLDEMPVFSLGATVNQSLYNALAARAAVHKVTQKNDLGIGTAVGPNQSKSALKLIKLSVYIANCV